MSSCLKMGLSLFFLLFLRLFAEINGRSQDECKVSRCSHHGPAIRFPFRLKEQPDYCGHPEFELSCSEKKQTMLELQPYSVKFSVKKINYSSQEIVVGDPDYCLHRQLQNRTLSASPFQLADTELENFNFFNCSANKAESIELTPIPCSLLSSNPVYVTRSLNPLRRVNLSSCRKIFNATFPNDIFAGKHDFSMHWLNPMCGNCEEEGKICRLKKSNSTEPEIECIDKPAKGVLIDKMVLTEAILGFLYLTLGIFIIFIFYRSNKLKKEHRINIEKFLEDYRALRPSRYSYADIKKITNNFKDKLGQGGYGIVYKGKLSNEVFVAVKILNDFKGNGEEFINEVGTMGMIHHINVVRLVGFCADGYKRALIYEFLPNESLDKFIFSTFVNNSLGWQKLHDIAVGIAKGIEYLHQGCDQRILHFDIKPHNILLDHNFNPKISDFGLAKLCSKELSAISMTTARGTMGYIAPEMISRNFGNVSYKSDVYSFGMLLLEMVGGRKNIDVTVENTSQAYFPEWLYDHLDQGDEVHIRIEEEGDAKIAKKLSIIGLWYIQWYPIDRPSMKVVVRMLEGEENDLIMPPNPFASMGQTRASVRRRKTPIQPELAIISEIE